MLRMMRTLFSLLAALALLTGVFASEAQPTRIIAPGDVVKVVCNEEPSLNKNYTVTADGLILLDFLGAVQISGLTAVDAAKRISDRLVEERILRRATLSLSFVSAPVASDKKVKVSGAVVRQDPIPWTAGMRLGDVVKLAQAANNADLTKIILAKADGSTMLVNFARHDPSTQANNPEVAPGDEVRIPVSGSSTPVPVPGPSQPNPPTPGPTPVNPAPGPITSGLVMVLGGVNKPGSYAMRANLTVRQAIDLAGGFSVRGDRTRVKLDRRGSTNSEVFDLTKTEGSNILKAGDQITVEVSSQRRFVQVLGSVRSPGLIEYTDGMTLTQAIAQAGGLNPGSKGEATIVGLEDGGKGRKVSYDDIVRGYRGDVALKSGDTVALGNVRLTDPAPKPKPGGGTTGGGTKTSRKKTSDTVVVAVAAGILIWLIGR